MGSVQTEIEKKAGIAAFEQFGFYNTVNVLAGGDVLKWTSILNLPYEMVYLKMLLNKTEQGYNKKWHELNEKK